MERTRKAKAEAESGPPGRPEMPFALQAVLPEPGFAIVGGALYTLGAVVYGFRRPDPWPRWFGFHEVFHTFTILAFVTHYVGVSLATYSLR